jgi:cadmium resistance protein CadD (predicted permease)
LLETAILALTAFASTNVDDAFVLLAFFSDPRFGVRDVVIGQYGGMAVLTLVAIACGLMAYAIPGRYVGLLGVFPILIGIARLRKVLRARRQAEDAVKLRAWGGAAAVAGVTISSGGDNVAAYIPLFAKASPKATVVICGVFAVLVALWCFAAHLLIRHSALSAIVRRWGGYLTPFVLMALGLYILLRSGALGAGG